MSEFSSSIDFRFQVKLYQKEPDHSLAPRLALSEEITDILVDEVIARHPDVLIMTGDNTNSGDPKEIPGLVEHAEELKEGSRLQDHAQGLVGLQLRTLDEGNDGDNRTARERGIIF